MSSSWWAQPTLLTLLLPLVAATAGADWTEFRGARGASIAADAQPPLEWDAESGKNVAWKVGLPGRGVSGPIVVSNRVIVTASSGAKESRLHVLCFAADSGKQLWHREFWATGRTNHHPTSSVAAPTPASDGQRIFAFFSSNDLICLDLDGNLIWYRGLSFDFPHAANDVGMSSSPAIVGDQVVVQVENQGDSFVAALDRLTGETRWRIDRPKESAWCSPVAVAAEGDRGELLMLQDPSGCSAHDPKTGEKLWGYDERCGGIPSPLGAKDLVLVVSKGLTALKRHPTTSEAEVVWNSNKLEPGNASPVVHQGVVYALNRAGALSAGSVTDGEVRWRLRIRGTYWATPIVAAGHLYCVNQEGVTSVVKLAADQGETVAENNLGEQVFGSPAIVGNAIYLRSHGHLWKMAAQSAPGESPAQPRSAP